MEITANNVFIRFFEANDAESLLDLRIRNKDLFQKYAPTFGEHYYSLEAIHKMIGNGEKQREEDKDYTFGVFLKENGRLIGDVSLFHIARGPLQKCMIGYTLDQAYNGKGYTTEAVSLVVEYAFQKLNFHRIEAGTMLSNVGSMRVLEKVGFLKEGIERQGVKINGNWEDHQIFAILSDIN